MMTENDIHRSEDIATLALSPESEVEADRSAHLPRLAARLPVALQHLAEKSCNPDLEQKWARKQGYMRSVRLQRQHENHTWSRTYYGTFRSTLGFCLRSRTVRCVLLLALCVDVVFTAVVYFGIVSFDNQSYAVTNIVVVVLLSIEVVARLVFEGIYFFKSYMNSFDFVVSILMLGEIVLLDGNSSYLSNLRIIRPILRVARVAGTILKTQRRILKHFKHHLSGDRVRFIQDGFDLDLAYIGSQILAMSQPSRGRDSAFYNSYWEVAAFLNERHGNRYLVLNTTNSKTYPLEPFFFRYYQFPIEQNSVPDLVALYRFCMVCDAFLEADPNHILAVHSRHGDGRTALVIIALLIYRGKYRNVESAIAYFERSRLQYDTQLVNSTYTFDCASQRRLLDYFLTLCHTENREEALATLSGRIVKLKRISFSGLRGMRFHRIVGYKCSSRFNRGNLFRRTHTVREQLVSKWRFLFDFSTLCHFFAICCFARRLQRRLEGALFDMIPFGSLPLRGHIPLFIKHINSFTTASFGYGSSPAPKNQVSLRDDEIEISGMFRIEIYGSSIGGVREHIPSREPGNEMLCSCWLHSALLELDSFPLKAAKESGPSVTVVLGRKDLDKASNAPPLHSYSEHFRIEIEFDVDDSVKHLGYIFPTNIYSSEHKQDLSPIRRNDTSEMYSLGWLTWVSERVWPFFEKGVEEWFRKKVVEVFNDALPGPLKGFRLPQFSLGRARPRFGAIKACVRRADGLNIQLAIFVSYETRSNIVLASSFVRLEVCSVACNGWVSLRLRPAATLRCLTSLQIFFVSQPEIQIKLGKSSDVVALKSVQRVLQTMIKKKVHKVMVLPNQIFIDLTSGAKSRLKFQQLIPCLMTRLRIAGARQLKVCGSLLKNRPDTYVRIAFGDQSAETSVVARSSNPVWNMEFDFLVHDEEQQIDCRVFNVDLTGRSHLIGSVDCLSVAELVGAGQDGKWFPLKESSGEVLLSCVMYEARMDTKALDVARRGALKLRARRGTQGCSHEDLPIKAMLSGMTSHSVGTQPLAQDDADECDLDEDLAAEAGTVALMICEVFGGNVPRDRMPIDAVELQISLGSSFCCRKWKEASPLSKQNETQKSIARLHALGLGADVIADALGEKVEDVTRFINRSSWNLKQTPPYCMLLQPVHLASTEIEVIVFSPKNCRVADSFIDMRKVLSDQECSFRGSITCAGQNHQDLCIQVDLKIQIYHLAPRLQRVNSKTSERSVDRVQSGVSAHLEREALTREV